ncbi:hypothetical protein L873DRAFT_1795930 [Choiromyces venosus 120613-1]|uniref:Uncharacterized protein n=1 Tax=Choiromyces venosus 120613-1 TaxID=1336337 RepID=A0A3N4IY57_9PEZI|nr:hypothetical protein L873DRAFT_1795930 [Choiromyces venosus 120613-1]
MENSITDVLNSARLAQTSTHAMSGQVDQVIGSSSNTGGMGKCEASKLGAIVYKGLGGDRFIGTTDLCNLGEEGGISIEVSEGNVQISSWAEFLNQSPEQDQDSQPSEQVEVDPCFVVCKR